MPYRMREVQQVVDEIVADGQPYAVFVDNNLGSRPAYLRKLCEALRPLGIIWSAAVTIDVTDDPTLVRDMARSGCTGVFVGFESLNEGNLTDARKRTPAPVDYARRVALLHRYGIQVNGSFVLGFDHDGPDVFARTVRMDRSEPPRMRDVPHPDAVSGHAAVPAARSARAHPASRLGQVRHRPRRLPAEAHELRGARSWLRVVLRQAVLARVDLEAPAERQQGGARISRDELSLQAIEPLLAHADPAPPHGGDLAAADRALAAAASQTAAAPGGTRWGLC